MPRLIQSDRQPTGNQHKLLHLSIFTLVRKSIYVRDGRSPIPANPNTSRVMSSIHGKHTKPEVRLRRALWSSKLRGYRLHLKQIPGRPDVVFASKKTAIFINGCFWHRCPSCNPNMPKSNIEFWMSKFERNQERDLRKIQQLKSMGWQVLTIWECEINRNIQDCVAKVKTELLTNE